MLVVARRKLIRPNPFAFPGTNPGFNPGHLAVHGYVCSAVAIPNGCAVDLITGKQGTIAGTVTGVLDTNGPGVSCITTTSDQVSFSGKPATADTDFTTAAIYRPTQTVGNNTGYYGGNSSTTTGAFIGNLFNTTNRFALSVSGSANSAGVIATNLPIINVPYFVGGSAHFDGTNWNFVIVVKRLDTGGFEGYNGATAGTAMSAPSGSYGIGSRSGNANSRGNTYAFMYGKGYALSLADLSRWSAAPWDFWYPQN
jgi:hypothetical protein